tara:strand:- start:11 stop:640 length:630 start_codon:yes stop_codon:yes gene_type:complete
MSDNRSLFPIEGLLDFRRGTYENTLSDRPLGGLLTDMWEQGKIPFAPSPRGLPSSGLLYMMTEQYLDDEGAKKEDPRSDKSLYHVTLSKSIPSIKKQGIGMMRTSNWARGEGGDRYGEGEIYSFEKKQDALNWAAKWDWELNNTFGSGGVSVIKHRAGDVPWEVDESDPLSQLMSKGKWFKRKHSVPKEDILDTEIFDANLFNEYKKGQ